MATNNSATVIPLIQPRKIPLTAAERAKNYRLRKKAKSVTSPVTETNVTQRDATSIALTVTAFTLAAVGVTMNGWFARSLGSTDIAGWLFLALGVAADLIALAIPASAARHWGAHRRGTAMAGWAVWSVTFAFAITAGIGFASVNVTDMTQARASRVTPAVETAQAGLADALAARDRECKGGVGKFCREREATVTERRQALDLAIASVGKTADPQTDATVRIVSWLSMGMIHPAGDDLATLRLILLSLLPQIGGIVLMIGRT